MRLADFALDRRGEELDSDARPVLLRIFEEVGRRRITDELGNGRFVRSLMEKAGQARDVRVMANTVEPWRDNLVTMAGDLEQAFAELCADAASVLAGTRCGEVRSAGHGSKGQRWYAWAWIATASARHHLLIRRHLRTGELAFCYCFVPDGQLLTKARLIRAAGLRWPVEEDFAFSNVCALHCVLFSLWFLE